MAVSLGGIDMLVFTGGIGENAAPVRSGIIEKLSFLPAFETRIIEADEERMIARYTLMRLKN
jgi:acetate kinase